MRCVKYTTSMEFNSDLMANGIDPGKFWALQGKDRSLILGRYAACVVQKVSNRRFNPSVHYRVVAKKKRYFFEWIKTLRCYEGIRK